MTWGHRELLWLLLLTPLTVAAAAWFWRRRLQATRQWVAPGLWERLRFVYRPRRLAASVGLLGLAVAGTGLGLTQPRWGESLELVERKGVDIVFIVDSSLSMSAEDIKPSRLYVAKTMVRSLVRALPGNRVAMVQAEGEGVVMSPLTVDSAVIDLLLDTTLAGTLPRPGTGLAHGLDLALGLFPQESEKHRVVVLLSDGEDHEGGLEERVRRLEGAGVVVHSLGIGTHRGGPMPLAGAGANELKRDAQGEVVITRLEEAPLRRLAEGTGGLYLQVTDAGQNLSRLVETISSMERHSFEGSVLSTQEDRFQWPLGIAAAGLTAFLAVAPIGRKGGPS
jgi:Ca-activated chloride channel family protein